MPTRGMIPRSFVSISWNGACVRSYLHAPTARNPQAYDAYLYRERHLVECFINKMKHYRRVFSRFEELDTRYLGFLQFTAALIWLR